MVIKSKLSHTGNIPKVSLKLLRKLSTIIVQITPNLKLNVSSLQHILRCPLYNIFLFTETVLNLFNE